MKSAKKLHSLFARPRWGMVLLLFTFVVVATSCDDDDNDVQPTQTQNIVQVAQSNSSLTTLVSALTKYPDLVTTLSSNGDFTVFAPTNAAFTNLLTAVGQASIDDVPEDVLKNILQYHVIATDELNASELTTGSLKTANTEDIAVTTAGGVKLNGAVNVTTADVETTNGVVHIVDAVLVPPSIVPIVGTIVAPAYFNKDFTTLIAAVKAADPTILTTLLGNGPSGNGLTLFAPTNAAFTAAGITSLPDQATLNAVLTYHVIDGEVPASELPEESSVIPTLNGDFYLSNNGSSGVFINGTTEVVATDIAGSNGVVHIIDRTLLPPSKTIAEIGIDLSTSSTPQFTQLVAALSRTSGTANDLLAAVSNSNANLTVFAPTDEAFAQLYAALGVDNVDEIPLPTLTAVLQHHVIAARVFSTDLVDGAAQTVNGEVTINAGDGTITDESGNVASLNTNSALLNVLATNGVIHTIDRVLLPESIF